MPIAGLHFMTGENCIIYEFHTCYPIMPCMLSLGLYNKIQQAGITLHLQIWPIFMHYVDHIIIKEYYMLPMFLG